MCDTVCALVGATYFGMNVRANNEQYQQQQQQSQRMCRMWWMLEMSPRLRLCVDLCLSKTKKKRKKPIVDLPCISYGENHFFLNTRVFRCIYISYCTIHWAAVRVHLNELLFSHRMKCVRTHNTHIHMHNLNSSVIHEEIHIQPLCSGGTLTFVQRLRCAAHYS